MQQYDQPTAPQQERMARLSVAPQQCSSKTRPPFHSSHAWHGCRLPPQQISTAHPPFQSRYAWSSGALKLMARVSRRQSRPGNKRLKPSAQVAKLSQICGRHGKRLNGSW